MFFSEKEKTILMIGPMPLDGEALGGAKTAFVRTVSELRRVDFFNIQVIDTSRKISKSTKKIRFLKNILAFFNVFNECLLNIRSADLVLVNMSSGGVISSFWAFFIIAKFFRKKIVLRVFGGNLYSEIMKKRAGCIPLYFIKRVDLLVLETKYLCGKFNAISAVHWLPNTRDFSPIGKRNLSSKNILFLSHVRKEKGLIELLEALKYLPDDVSLKIYGSVGFDIDPECIAHYPKAEYCGLAASDDVESILSASDLVVLPTYYDGEGYPGTIIEAFQTGIPVVATRWNAIPEVVDDSCGILVEPRDVQELAHAIKLLAESPDLYNAKCEGALKKGELYRSDKVFCDLKNKLFSLMKMP